MEAIVKSIPMYYEEYGTGIPLLMLHGWPADHSSMVFDMEPIFQNRTGWRRLYPDLPGMGKTPGADWITNQDHMLEVVIEFMQTVAPNERFVVAGVSYGGYLTLGLVYRQSLMIDGILLLVPAVERDPKKQKLPEAEVIHEDAQFLAALTPEENDLRNLVVVQSLDFLEALRTVLMPAFAIADHTFLKKLRENNSFSFSVNQLSEPFPGPTLIVTGRQDSLCGYREAWAILDDYPRGTFAVLDRAGHGLGVEQKRLFRALASEWLDRVEEYIGKSGIPS